MQGNEGVFVADDHPLHEYKSFVAGSAAIGGASACIGVP